MRLQAKRPRHSGVRIAVVVAATLFSLSLASPVFAHEERTVAGYDVEVGLIDEPVFVGQKSGLEFFVHKGETAITGLDKTVKAQVTFGGQTRDLPVRARFDEDGAYDSVFIPTGAGKYTFHLTGTIEGQAIDESFTSGPTGFSEVNEAATGQFPNVLPTTTEVLADAKKGADAAGQLPLAIGLGAAGAVLGLFALAVSLAGRRRPA